MSDILPRSDLYLGGVLLYRGTALISRAIRLLDGTEVSHAGLLTGGEVVAEALGQGLVTRSLDESVTGAEWVMVRRLKDTPTDMTPVETKGLEYVAAGNRYAYEQILLLAFLCLTRKPKVTPALRALVRTALETAASLLTRLASQGRQPMICSEFVYRAYDEALPEARDFYSLSIPYASLPSGTRSRSAGVRTGAELLEAGAGSTPAQGIHPGSLLGWASTPAHRAWIGSAPTGGVPAPDPEIAERIGGRTRGGSAGPPNASTPELDTLIGQYLDEVTMPPNRTTRSAAGFTVSDLELQQAIDQFAVSWYGADVVAGGRTEARTDTATRASGTRSTATLPRAFQHLVRTAADFVTPGDLLKTESLYTLGRLA